MTLAQLASKIAKQEGKRHQASIGDVREILSIVMDEAAKNPEAEALLLRVIRLRRGKEPKKKA